MSVSTKNRNQSYFIETKNFPAKRRLIYDYIRSFGPITAQEIARRAMIGINEVVGRISELKDLALIEEIGSKENSWSHKGNTIYQVVPEDKIRDKLNQRYAELVALRDELVDDFNQKISPWTRDTLDRKIKKLSTKIRQISKL